MQFLPKKMKFTVTDEVTAKCAEYNKKEFLLHCETEPTVNRDTVILQNDTLPSELINTDL